MYRIPSTYSNLPHTLKVYACFNYNNKLLDTICCVCTTFQLWYFNISNYDTSAKNGFGDMYYNKREYGTLILLPPF